VDFTIIDRYDLAETELEQAAFLKPGSAEIRYLLGRVYYTRGVYPLAKGELEAAIRLNPTNMKAYDNLGLTMEALGNNAAALENHQKAIQLNAQQRLGSAWPFVNLASFYNRQSMPDEALVYSQKAIEFDPRADQAYFQMAKAHESRNEWDEAAKALRKAIEISPGSANYHYVLSVVYKKLGKLKESQEAIEAFRKLQFEQGSAVQPPMGRGARHPISPSGPQ
jgi:tetratricopeptide (TPR) repeat protein